MASAEKNRLPIAIFECGLHPQWAFYTISSLSELTLVVSRMGSPTAAILDLDEHINDNRQPYIIAASAICLFAAYIAVTLRFIARRLARNSVEADDYTVLLALFFTSVFATVTLIGVHYGLGKPWILVANKTIYTKVVLVLACTCEISF